MSQNLSTSGYSQNPIFSKPLKEFSLQEEVKNKVNLQEKKDEEKEGENEHWIVSLKYQYNGG